MRASRRSKVCASWISTVIEDITANETYVHQKGHLLTNFKSQAIGISNVHRSTKKKTIRSCVCAKMCPLFFITRGMLVLSLLSSVCGHLGPRLVALLFEADVLVPHGPRQPLTEQIEHAPHQAGRGYEHCAQWRAQHLEKEKKEETNFTWAIYNYHTRSQFTLRIG